ncbi:hypothetical protein Dimus_003087, partial [Dionaea muscipula]
MALHEAAGRCSFADCDGGGADPISIAKTLDTDPEWLAAPVSSDNTSRVFPARRRCPSNQRPTSALFVRRRALLSLVRLFFIHHERLRIELGEADITKERIDKLLKVGANVILTTKGIDDMELKAGAITVRNVRKEDMRHVAKTTGATL